MRISLSKYRISSWLTGALLLAGVLLCSTPSVLWAETGVGSVHRGTENNWNGHPYRVKEFTIDGPGVLRVSTPAGNVEVENGTDDHTVRIELYLDRGYAFWSNTKNLDNYRITMIQRGNEIEASVENKSKESGFFSDPMRFSYKIYVPQRMSTELKTSGGHISLVGVQGDQLMKSSGGNIKASEIKGGIKAYTSGGNIEIDASRGTIFARTEGGNITIENCQGELRLKTDGGKIVGDRISGSMLAEVGGGDIYAHFLEISQGINLKTSAGNIDVKMPEAGYDLLLQGTSVNLSDAENFQGEKHHDSVDGTLGQGGIPVNLATHYGTITITTYK